MLNTENPIRSFLLNYETDDQALIDLAHRYWNVGKADPTPLYPYGQYKFIESVDTISKDTGIASHKIASVLRGKISCVFPQWRCQSCTCAHVVDTRTSFLSDKSSAYLCHTCLRTSRQVAEQNHGHVEKAYKSMEYEEVKDIHMDLSAECHNRLRNYLRWVVKEYNNYCHENSKAGFEMLFNDLIDDVSTVFPNDMAAVNQFISTFLVNP